MIRSLTNRREFVKKAGLFVPATFFIPRLKAASALGYQMAAAKKKAVGGGPSYLISVDPSGSTPAGWTDGGSFVWNGTGIVGSNSAQSADSADNSASPTIAGGSETWAFGVITLSATPGTNTYVIQLRNSTTLLCAVQFRSAAGSVRLYHGTVTPGSNTIPAYSAATPYYYWIRYVPSSGANDGIAELYFSTTQTRGAALTSTAIGNATASIDNLYFGGINSVTINIDKIRVDDEEIGSSPA